MFVGLCIAIPYWGALGLPLEYDFSCGALVCANWLQKERLDGARMATRFHMRRIIHVRTQRTASDAAAVSPAIFAAGATAAYARAAKPKPPKPSYQLAQHPRRVPAAWRYSPRSAAQKQSRSTTLRLN
jgi:hypothetical protein